MKLLIFGCSCFTWACITSLTGRSCNVNLYFGVPFLTMNPWSTLLAWIIIWPVPKKVWLVIFAVHRAILYCAKPFLHGRLSRHCFTWETTGFTTYHLSGPLSEEMELLPCFFVSDGFCAVDRLFCGSLITITVSRHDVASKTKQREATSPRTSITYWSWHGRVWALIQYQGPIKAWRPTRSASDHYHHNVTCICNLYASLKRN